jgi:hypothetical protein
MREQRNDQSGLAGGLGSRRTAHYTHHLGGRAAVILLALAAFSAKKADFVASDVPMTASAQPLPSAG